MGGAGRIQCELHLDWGGWVKKPLETVVEMLEIDGAYVKQD